MSGGNPKDPLPIGAENCKESAGLLIPRRCKQGATVRCQACGKPVCGQHTANLPTGGLGCATCARVSPVGDPMYRPASVYESYGYHPMYLTGWRSSVGPSYSASGYTESDYAAFESGAPGQPLDTLSEDVHGS